MQEFSQEHIPGAEAVAIKPEHDKLSRLIGQTATIEGFVYLPRVAHWLADYIEELITFPAGRYDDQVDSTSQALAYMRSTQSSLDVWRKLGRMDAHLDHVLFGPQRS